MENIEFLKITDSEILESEKKDLLGYKLDTMCNNDLNNLITLINAIENNVPIYLRIGRTVLMDIK